jgi:hypothetical protein
LRFEDSSQAKLSIRSKLPISGFGTFRTCCRSKRSPGERSDTRGLHELSRMSRSLSSGAHSRDPLAHPGYAASSSLVAAR